MAADDGAADFPLSPFSSFPSPPKKKAGLRPTYLEGGNNKLQQAQVRSESSAHWPLSYEGEEEASLGRPGKKGERGRRNGGCSSRSVPT